MTIPIFIFTTCGLYPTNTLRIFAKKCVPLNIIPVISKHYRCIATDGSLLAPFMNCWFKHEKNLHNKIERDISSFMELLNQSMSVSIPRMKLYSIVNYPNKLLGRTLLLVFIFIRSGVSNVICVLIIVQYQHLKKIVMVIQWLISLGALIVIDVSIIVLNQLYHCFLNDHLEKLYMIYINE